jgi:pyrroloquinoline quinone (PQQ) biosynthesis protein C
MRYAAERFSAMGNPAMAEYCLHVAEEETGHDVLALKDLESLGLRSEAFVRDIQPASSLAMVEIFQRFAHGPSPIAVLGYAYALERFALFQTASSIEAIEAILPPGINATRCLRVHSSVGTDAHHVAESVDFIASLGRDDRKEIAMAAFETAAVMAAPSDYPGNEAMTSIIGRYRN